MNVTLRYVTFSTLNPIVGTVVSTSPMCSLYRMVVLPAASSPSMTTRISRLPNDAKSLAMALPIFLLLLLSAHRRTGKRARAGGSAARRRSARRRRRRRSAAWRARARRLSGWLAVCLPAGLPGVRAREGPVVNQTIVFLLRASCAERLSMPTFAFSRRQENCPLPKTPAGSASETEEERA